MAHLESYTNKNMFLAREPLKTVVSGYIVASYLVFYLNIDWRVGADWFESLLLDHDVCSNYGRDTDGKWTEEHKETMGTQWNGSKYRQSTGCQCRFLLPLCWSEKTMSWGCDCSLLFFSEFT